MVVWHLALGTMRKSPKREDDAMSKTAGREQYLDKCQGCLLGGAIGDALGYPVEFYRYEGIVREYGERGITAFAPGEPVFSDDTQMTLFTAMGLLVGDTQAAFAGTPGRLENPCHYVNLAYLDWLATQYGDSKSTPHISWIMEIPRLNRLRAPGNTCLSSLSAGGGGTIANRINHSKGCGGVMRVAPWGLFLQGEERLGPDGTDENLTWLVREGAGMAALTHGHPLGWIPAGALCYLVNRCAFDVSEGVADPRAELDAIVADCIRLLPAWFPEVPDDVREMVGLLEDARRLAASDAPDLACIRMLGEGWVGEEALAISVFSALRHANDFSAAIVSAVNHSGDSDSTGAICGNIVGALLGAGAIEPKWDAIELRDEILGIARDLCLRCPVDESGACADEGWLDRYGTLADEG